MESKEKIVLKKMAEHASKIVEYSKGINDVATFEGTELTCDACCFNLLQIGELAKQFLSDETKAQLKSIPWEEIQGLRNRIVHGYASVQMNIIFQTIKNDIPGLIQEITLAINN